MVKEFSMTDKEKYINLKLFEEGYWTSAETKKCLKRCFGIYFYEDELEERNDIHIYKTLRYPPKSTPPTAN